jgi:predicted ABC-type ATPase
MPQAASAGRDSRAARKGRTGAGCTERNGRLCSRSSTADACRATIPAAAPPGKSLARSSWDARARKHRGNFALSLFEPPSRDIMPTRYTWIEQARLAGYSLSRYAYRMPRRKKRPRCIVIAGPNGAGKTTFARRYLPEDAGVVHFVNADLIAGGLSPLDPRLAAVRAGRLVLQEIDRLATERANFAFETTLSGLGHARRMIAWKRAGYRVEMVYLKLKSSRLALRRIAARVREGGHDVPRADVVRRFARGWANFEHVYRPLADAWAVYDNSGQEPQLLETSG